MVWTHWVATEGGAGELNAPQLTVYTPMCEIMGKHTLDIKCPHGRTVIAAKSG